MLEWNELKDRRDLTSQIDWEMDPQEAFQAYQCMSPDAWKQCNLEDVMYFVVSVIRGDTKVLLIERTYTDSEEIAEAPAPPELFTDELPRDNKGRIPTGQYPLTPQLKDWVQTELGVGSV